MPFALAFLRGYGYNTVMSKTTLTPTQTKVLALIASGLASSDAASKLGVSKRTVDFHLANIYDQFEVNNRVQAMRRAIRLGIISPITD